MNFSPEAEIVKLFESTKRKFLHILFSDGMYFAKAKFESFSFEKMTFKNKFYFELKVYNSLGFYSMFCVTNEMLQWIEKILCESN